MFSDPPESFSVMSSTHINVNFNLSKSRSSKKRSPISWKKRTQEKEGSSWSLFLKMFSRSKSNIPGVEAGFPGSSSRLSLDDDSVDFGDAGISSSKGDAGPSSAAAAQGFRGALPVQRLEAEAQRLSMALNESVTQRIVDPLMAKLRAGDMRAMFSCCVTCTEVDASVDFNATQQCVQSCQAPFQEKMNQLQESAQRVGRQASECVQECMYPLRSKQQHELTDADVDRFMACSDGCVSSIDYPRLRTRIEGLLWAAPSSRSRRH